MLIQVTYQRDEKQLEWILIIAILVLTFFVLFYLGLTITKRARKASRNKRRNIYQKKADEILFALLFDQITMDEAVKMYLQSGFNDSLSKKIFIRSLIGLHRSYSGLQKEKLEDFYRKAGLVEYSLKKLRDADWARKIEAIRDLSTMNCQHAYNEIKALLKHPHDLVQKEALIATVKLRGLEVILSGEYDLYLDDWTQANILFTIKTLQVPPTEDISQLLKSENEGRIVLGARLLDHYQMKQFAELLSAASRKIKSNINQLEMQRVSERLGIC